MAGRKGAARWVEPAKTLLILLLACSAVFLAAHTNAYRSLSDKLGGTVSALLRPVSSPGGTAGPSSGRPMAASRPVAAALWMEDGSGRYAVQYDDEGVSDLYGQHSALLGEALAVAQPPRSASRAVWHAALQSPGLYVHFPTPVPLSALYAWLGEGAENPALNAASALRLVLCRGSGDSVELFFHTGTEDGYFRCATGLSYGEHLAPQLSGYSANGALFAFESGGSDRGGLAPDVLLCPSPAPKLYQGSTPLDLGDRDDLDALQRQLGFHPQFSTVINLPDVVSVREDEDTLRISSAGLLTFHAEAREAPRYPVGEGDAPATATQLIDASFRLAEAALGSRCGDAALSLTALTPQNDGGVEITFDYYLNGAAVVLLGGGSAARFRVYRGQITDFWLRFRRYEDTGESWLLLPEEQAVAAMGALSTRGGSLVRRYRDGSGDGIPVTAAWALVE